MPLRKKHVRRIVLVLVLVGVLGPTAALTFYGFWLRGGAYDRALEGELASRLRCEAAVRGARPTGPSTAAADSVDLCWTAGDGRLRLHLEGLTAESNRFGWYVTAGEGTLLLTGPAPWDTLAALNQRLVQTTMPPLMALTVNRLKMDLDLAEVKVESTVRATASSDLKAFTVSLRGPDEAAAPSCEPRQEIPRPMVLLHLDPTCDRGVFGGLHVRAKDVPLGVLRRTLKMDGGENPPAVRGTADVAVTWRQPGAPDQLGIDTVQVVAGPVDLAEWTKGLPGGPIAGTAAVEVIWSKNRSGTTAIEVDLTCGRGAIGGETLRWLAGLPAGLQTFAVAPDKKAPFDRLRVHCQVVGNRGWFDGPPDKSGGIALMTCRLFGVDVPILAASRRPFDAQAAWAPLRKALVAD